MPIPLLPDDITADVAAAPLFPGDDRPLTGRELAHRPDDQRDPGRDDWAPLGRAAPIPPQVLTESGGRDHELPATRPAGPTIWGERYGAHSARTVMCAATDVEAIRAVGMNETGRPRRVTIHAIYPSAGGDYVAMGPTREAALSGRGNGAGEGFLLTVPVVTYSDAEIWVFGAVDARVSVLIEY